MGAIIRLNTSQGRWGGGSKVQQFTSSGNTGMQHRRTSTSGISASYLQVFITVLST